MVIRSFLAFEIDPKVKKVVEEVSYYLQNSSIHAKWVRPENIHITLIFMGNIKINMLEAIKKEIKEVTHRTECMKVRLKGMGCFPDKRRPRVIWIGLDGDIKKMGELKDNLMKKLKSFGIKDEKREFKPHLTLGRFKKSGPSLGNQLNEAFERYSSLTSEDFILRELILFKSELRPEGANYTKIFSFPLKEK